MDTRLQLAFFLLLPLVELIILFFLSKVLINRIARFFHLFIGRTKWRYYLLAVLFLPGTYIHELSHYIFAKILFVPVFGMNLVPIIEGNQIQLGSVEIAKTGFIRRFIVGAAPVFCGISLILGSIYIFLIYNAKATPLAIMGISFLVFQIGNTMFLSKKDLEGAWKMGFLVLLILLIAYIFGFNFESSILSLRIHQEIFMQLSYYFLVPIAIDSILIVLLNIIT